MTDDNIIVEFHESTRVSGSVQRVADADVVLIAHGDGTVTCVKDRPGVTYKRRSRNGLPPGHLYAVEDAEVGRDQP